MVHQHPGAAGVSPNAPLPRQRGGSSGSRGNASPAKQRRGHGGRPTPALTVYIPAAPSQAAPARLRQLGWGWSARRHALEGGQEELPASAAPSNPLARVQRPRSKRRRAGGLTCRGKPLLARRFVSSPPPTAQRQQPLSSPLRLLPRLTTVPGSPCRPRGSFPLRSKREGEGAQPLLLARDGERENDALGLGLVSLSAVAAAGEPGDSTPWSMVHLQTTAPARHGAATANHPAPDFPVGS